MNPLRVKPSQVSSNVGTIKYVHILERFMLIY